MSSLESSSEHEYPRPDLLVVGHASFTAINRNVYVRLASQSRNVEMVIPRFVPYFERAAEARRPQDPLIHWVEIGKITNQRFWDFKGLAEVLERRQPRAIFLEADPATRLAIKVSRWARRNHATLFCYTNENILYPIARSLAQGRLAAAARSIRSSLLAPFSRSGITHVFVLCNAAVDSMKLLGFGDRISKMPLGFDPEVFHVDHEKRKRIRAISHLLDPVIAYIGRVAPGKGLEHLVDALGMLTDLKWHFLIDDFSSAKPGDYPDNIRKQIEANSVVAQRCTRFHADHYEIAAYINAADIIVAPSCLPEQYGRVLAEAMACGKVVVASDAGAYPEIVRDGGIIVPSGQPGALAAALREAIETPALGANLAGKALTRAHALTIDVQAEIIARELERALMKESEPAAEPCRSTDN